jgi:hypothetical protein
MHRLTDKSVSEGGPTGTKETNTDRFDAGFGASVRRSDLELD